MAQLRQKFGLDRPLAVQLLLYLKGMLVLDLGYSFRHNMPVLELILGRLGPTLLLMVTTLVASVATGIVLGLLAAARAGSWRDTLISILALVSYATPLFWAGPDVDRGLLAQARLAAHERDGDSRRVQRGLGARRRHRSPSRPAGADAVALLLALYTRLMRAAMLEQSGMDYVTTARAKGLTERQIARRHMLRNAVLPVLTMAGVQVGGLLGGSVVVETVFAGRGSACSPTSRCSRATSTCCSASSSSAPAWWSS